MSLKSNNKWVTTGWLITTIVLLTCFANAQTRLTGRITDSTTLKALAAASVYIGNSTVGTKTNENGVFTFQNITPGNYQLLISYIGYQTKQVELPIASGDNILNIVLNPRAIELNEVAIHANNDWKKNFTLFKREFIGTNDAEECKVLNQDILNLDFDYKKNLLTASTKDFLDIKNSILGYKLRFLIKDFWADYKTGKCHYSGTVIFEELLGKKSDQKKWAKNRMEVYKGSFRHFLTSLSLDQTDKDKFIIRKLTRVPDIRRPADSVIRAQIKKFTAQFESRGYNHASDSLDNWRQLLRSKKIIETLAKAPLHAGDIMHPSTQQELYDLQFDGYVYVIYKNKRVNEDTDDLFRFMDARSFQTSAISLKNPGKPIVFNSKGVLLTNDGAYYEGAWNNRIINILPDDYVPGQK